MITIFKKILIRLRRGSIDGNNRNEVPYLVNIASFQNRDGTFNYEKYRKIQEEANKRKIEKVWVLKENILFLSTYLNDRLGIIKSGICHGTRRGLEQQWFRKYLSCDVIGTEISDTANQFPYTIQWDFHKVKSEWINTIDFIYSNSFDHSYNPELCLNSWMSCIRPGGICILEHTDRHGVSTVTEMDPFGAELYVMPYLVLKWAQGKYYVREILEAPSKRDDTTFTCFIVIEKSLQS